MVRLREKIQWKNQLVNLLAIVIGVYIAFALTDWQATRSQKAKKREYIASLKEELLKDREELENGVKEIDTLTYKIRGLFRYINQDEHAADSGNYFLSGILSQPTFNPTNFTFQSLVNSGDMGGFTDISFKKDLIELYNGDYNTIKDLDEIGLKNFQEHVISTLIQRGGRFEDDYIRSPSFAALAGVIQDLLNSRKRAYEKSLQLIDKILAQIEIGAA
jgi:hypothetical protein